MAFTVSFKTEKNLQLSQNTNQHVCLGIRVYGCGIGIFFFHSSIVGLSVDQSTTSVKYLNYF